MAPLAPPTFKFIVPSSLSAFNTTTTAYLAANPAHQVLSSGALIFDDQDRILLLQRAPHDSFPNRWETPGGAVDAADPSILHGVAREVWEEAGLVVTGFQQRVGPGRTFQFAPGAPKWLKLEFWVAVEGGAAVSVDPGEHQRFVWAGEEECRTRRVGSGEGALEIELTSPEMQDTILEGFRLRRETKGDVLPEVMN